MDYITLSDKQYPLRFDLRALKEYKAKTKNDVLEEFKATTENIIALAYCAIKSGYKFSNEDGSKLTEELVADITTVRDLKKITAALIAQTSSNEEPSEGEGKPA
jgi:hypothetical protein